MRFLLQIICLLTLIFLPFQSQAQNNQDIVTKENLKKLSKITEYLGECSMIIKSMDRLRCFDDIIERFNITEPTSLSEIETPLDIGNWIIQEEPADIDGNHVIFMKLEPENSILMDGRQKRPELIVRCVADSADYTGSVYIVWDQVMGRAGKLYTRMRLDREMPIGGYWDLSSDRKGSFHPDPFELIKTMLNHSVIRINVRDKGIEMFPTIIYDIRGFDNVVRTVRNQCNWA